MDSSAGAITARETMTPQATPKGWYITAMAIGALVFIGGGTGILGLLHSKGVIHLPQPIASIGSIGDTYLWVMGAGGVSVGAGLIVFGAYKYHRVKVEEDARKEQDDDFLEGLLSRNNFRAAALNRRDFSTLPKMTYQIHNYPEAMHVIIAHENILECSRIIDTKTKDRAVALLKARNLKEAPKVDDVDRSPLKATTVSRGADLAQIARQAQTIDSFTAENCKRLNPQESLSLNNGLQKGQWVLREFNVTSPFKFIIIRKNIETDVLEAVVSITKAESSAIQVALRAKNYQYTKFELANDKAAKT